jgi:hypothetical protein
VYLYTLREGADVKVKDFGPKVEGSFLNSAHEREHIYIYICFVFCAAKNSIKNKDVLHKF